MTGAIGHTAFVKISPDSGPMKWNRNGTERSATGPGSRLRKYDDWLYPFSPYSPHASIDEGIAGLGGVPAGSSFINQTR